MDRIEIIDHAIDHTPGGLMDQAGLIEVGMVSGNLCNNRTE